jgi:hypothetical protein
MPINDNNPEERIILRMRPIDEKEEAAITRLSVKAVPGDEAQIVNP